MVKLWNNWPQAEKQWSMKGILKFTLHYRGIILVNWIAHAYIVCLISITAEKRLRMRGHKKDGEEFKCQIVNKNMAI
jgi:hypothetical protein